MLPLDSNVLSALMAARPPPEVASWVSARPAGLLFTAAICQAEILAGLAVLPDGGPAGRAPPAGFVSKSEAA